MKKRGLVHLFYATVRDGHLMSWPRYEPRLDLIQQLVCAIERLSPRFAWIQFLFASRDYSGELYRMRMRMSRAKEEMERPGLTLTGDLVEKHELHGTFYGRMDERIKRTEEMISKAVVVMAVQGLWVGEESAQIQGLPISLCRDEIDRLQAFTVLDSRMLVELVERRMVEDMAPFMRGYTGARVRPPSFLITADELPCYVHFPSGARLHVMRSITDWSAHSPLPLGSEMGEMEEPERVEDAEVLRVRPPGIMTPLTEEESSRLAHLASTQRRGFEVVYDGGRTSFYLSSAGGDMASYRSAVEAVYGTLECEACDPRPDFLFEIPRLMGLPDPP